MLIQWKAKNTTQINQYIKEDQVKKVQKIHSEALVCKFKKTIDGFLFALGVGGDI